MLNCICKSRRKFNVISKNYYFECLCFNIKMNNLNANWFDDPKFDNFWKCYSNVETYKRNFFLDILLFFYFH
jgi:hypothetical protein